MTPLILILGVMVPPQAAKHVQKITDIKQEQILIKEKFCSFLQKKTLMAKTSEGTKIGPRVNVVIF